MDTDKFRGIINKFAEMVLQNASVFAFKKEPSMSGSLPYASGGEHSEPDP